MNSEGKVQCAQCTEYVSIALKGEWQEIPAHIRLYVKTKDFNPEILLHLKARPFEWCIAT